jgi:O-antigen/teichoic acid export membrane protein
MDMTQDSQNVRDELRRGALWSTISRFATRFILFGTTIVLARVLSPSDFGVVALGMVVWSLAGLFADLGVSASLIQAKGQVDEQANASFWLNLFIGAGLSLLTFAAAPLVGRFYGNELVAPILRVQGLSFFLNGFVTVQTVLLTKKMDFQKLAQVEIVTGFTERFLALILAFSGFAAWSLVVPSIVIIPIRTVMLWRASSFRPRLNIGSEQWPRIFHFGKHVFATTMLRYININGDYFVIGKVMGPTPLGIYTFAYNLANWPIENIVWVINKVSFPAFAKLQDTPDEFRRIYRQIIQSVSMLAFPIMMGMFAVADQMVVQIYGSKWQEGILPLKIIIGFMLIRTIASPGGGVLLALGKPKIEFHFNLIQLPLLLTAIIIGSRYGIVGVAWGMAGVLGLMGFIFIRIAQSSIHLDWHDFYEDIRAPATSGILMVAGIRLFHHLVEGYVGHAGWQLGLDVALGLILYPGLMRLLFPSRFQYAWALAKGFIKKGKELKS